MNCKFSRLPEDALLHITGPDTLTFLQGQTTCDTRDIDDHRAALGAYCTPQGRVVCDFLLAQLGEEHYVLRMRRPVRESAAAVFGKYIVFSKAEIDAQRSDWEVYALWGADAATCLKDVFGQSPAQQMGCVSGEGFVALQVDASGECFEIYATSGSAHIERLAAAASAAESDEWQCLQIYAGIARIEAQTVEAFVPQVLNYDLTGHISFTKGCYTGQEVVARLHYRGKSKRRTYVARLPRIAKANDPLFGAGSEQSVGNVVNAVADTDGVVALVAATETAASAALYLDTAGEEAVSLLDLPYSLDSD